MSRPAKDRPSRGLGLPRGAPRGGAEAPRPHRRRRDGLREIDAGPQEANAFLDFNGNATVLGRKTFLRQSNNPW